ncbi:MAG: hypothetical protein HeimC2_14300 [Candidatus Heimdallarchaeota archaeon LC_2]|nr:MAG: hypothetical protein HeimC2_14300 [Candidatus Heimdallarchaeota archaeon LC_2]
MMSSGNSIILAESAKDYSAGTISGATMADLANITYTDTSISTLMLSDVVHRGSMGFIDRIGIRSAFSIRSAVILMDQYDSRWQEEHDLEVFTGVPGSEFTTATALNPEYFNYFDSSTDDGISIHLGQSTINDTDGDIGGNKTLSEDSYRANIDYKNFQTSDYKAINQSEIENLNTAYADLTDDLLDTPEEENEWDYSANDIVVAGHNNPEAATLDVLRKRVALILNVLPSHIRIDNYTITDFWFESILAEGLAGDIRDAYSDAKSAGFISRFEVTTPLKVSRLGMDQPMSTFKSDYAPIPVGVISHSDVRPFAVTRGNTAVTNSMAFKDTVVKDTYSDHTGLKEKAYTNFFKIGAWLASKTGTQKIYQKAFMWFAGLDTKYQNLIVYGFWIVVGLLTVLLVWWVLKRVKGNRRMRG